MAEKLIMSGWNDGKSDGWVTFASRDDIHVQMQIRKSTGWKTLIKSIAHSRTIILNSYINMF